jgi:hypothetical protein
MTADEAVPLWIQVSALVAQALGLPRDVLLRTAIESIRQAASSASL